MDGTLCKTWFLITIISIRAPSKMKTKAEPGKKLNSKRKKGKKKTIIE